MKKLSDKVVCIICTIAMCITCTFSYSWKIAHKTYADTVPTTKQELGMWLSSILASVGARAYIATAQGYEWLADNFDAVMDSIGSAIYLVDLVQDAQNRYDQANSKVVLGEESSKALTGFLQSLVNEGFSEDSTDFDVGEYEIHITGTYATLLDGVMTEVGITNDNTTNQYCLTRGHDCRVVAVYYPNTPTAGYVVMVSTDSTGDAWQGTGRTASTATGTRRNWNYISTVVNNVSYYWNTSAMSSYRTYNIPKVASIYGTSERDFVKTAIEYCYGASAQPDGVQEVQVYGDGTLGLDDMIDTYDRNKEAEIDYSDFLGEDAGTKTLAEIMALIQEAINSGNTELVDAIPQAEVIIKTPIILPENVDIPLLFQGLPEVVEPECVTLGGCLVSGVQTVSQHLQNVYSSHSAISNFTAVSLALGVAIYIITGGL